MKAQKPSRTAALILRAMLFSAERADLKGLVPERARQLNSAIGGIVLGARFERLLKLRAFRWSLAALERIMNPGFVCHVAHRKSEIEASTRRALANGSSSVLVIGAGFDTLGLRLAEEFPSLQVVEIDRIETVRLKRKALGNQAPSNLKLVPADLAREPLSEVIREVGLQNPVVIAEGVLMYLSPEEAETLLKQISSFASHVVLTFMEEDLKRGHQFRGANPVIRWWLARIKEPFRSGFNAATLGSRMASLGFRDARVIDCSRFEISGGKRIAEGELLCEARVASEC